MTTSKAVLRVIVAVGAFLPAISRAEVPDGDFKEVSNITSVRVVNTKGQLSLQVFGSGTGALSVAAGENPAVIDACLKVALAAQATGKTFGLNTGAAGATVSCSVGASIGEGFDPTNADGVVGADQRLPRRPKP